MNSSILYTPILYKLEENEYYYDNYYHQIKYKYNLFINKFLNISMNKGYINSSKFIENGKILKNTLIDNFDKKIINYFLIIKEYKYLIKISNSDIEIEMFKSLIEEYNNKIKNIIFLKNKELLYKFDIIYIKKYIQNKYIF